MLTKKINIDELKEPYKFKNYNKHPEEQIDEICKSLDRFSQFKNIVIWKDNQVIAGNGLVMAARRNGLESIHVVDMSHLSKPEAAELMIADNAIPIGSEPDEGILFELFESFKFPDVPGFDFLGLDISENEMNLKEKTEKIRPIEYSRILVSVPIYLAVEFKEKFEVIEKMEGVEILYGS